MKTYTTTQGQEFTIDYASAITAGYGHQKITVSVVAENGDKKDFSAKTNNMPDFDEATDLEGQEKYEALFELVEYSLDGEICEWLYELEKTYFVEVEKGNDWEAGYLNFSGEVVEDIKDAMDFNSKEDAEEAAFAFNSDFGRNNKIYARVK